ncbi:MAG: transposase, partial [Acidobacteriota bacterium]
FRDECLNTHWFLSLADARRLIEAWRRDYNQVRPQSSLDGEPPNEYARDLQNSCYQNGQQVSTSRVVWNDGTIKQEF